MDNNINNNELTEEIMDDILMSEIAVLRIQNLFMGALNWLFIAGCSVLAVCITVNRVFPNVRLPLYIIALFITAELILYKIISGRNSRLIKRRLELIGEDNADLDTGDDNDGF